MVNLQIAFISIILCKGDEDSNVSNKSSESEEPEALPTPEALTFYKKVGNKALPLNVVKRQDSVVVLREKREPPIRIRKRRPKPPPPSYIRRPPSKPKSKGKPKPKYGPPGHISSKPISGYPTKFSENFFNQPGSFQGTQGFNSLLDSNIYSSSLPVVYPAQTFGEPPVIPVATIATESKNKNPPNPPKTRYGIPHFSSSSSSAASPSQIAYAGSASHSFDNNHSSKYKRPGSRPSSNFGNPSISSSSGPFPTGNSSPSFPTSSGFTSGLGFPSSPSAFPASGGGFPVTSFSSPQSSGLKEFYENSNTDFDTQKTTSLEFDSYKESNKKSPPKNYNIPDFPLENMFGKDLYKTSVSSYDVPTYDHGKGAISYSTNSAKVPNLPNYYDQNEFKTPTRTSNGLQTSASNIYDPEDYTAYINDVSESKKVHVKAKQKTKSPPPIKFEDLEKELKSIKIPLSDESRDDIKYAFTSRTTTTTTTKKPRYRRKKKPKITTSDQHNLDTDDLRDAFGDNTHYHEVSLTPDELLEFEPQRKVVHSRPVGVSSSKNYVLLSSQNKGAKSSEEEEDEPPRTKIHSTLTRTRYKNANKPNYPSSFPMKSAQTKKNEGVQIVSIEKSKSHSFYGGAVPENDFLNSYGLSRRNDGTVNEYSVGTGISFGRPIQPQSNRKNGHLGDTITGIWDADYDPLPKNHKFS